MKEFRKGIIDALPVFAGYFSVALTFGLAAAKSWDSLALPVLTSMTHLSGTGQFVLVSLYDGGSPVAAIVSGIVAINLRYFPMAMAVSQRIPPRTSFWRRLAVAFGMTDEIVGITLQRPAPLPFAYIAGLTVCSWSGWVLGTIAGANPATSAIMPPRLASALGIAFPAMFAAIVLPVFRSSARIRAAIAMAAAASLVLRALPLGIDPGWIVLASGIAAAAVAAAIAPAASGAANAKGEAKP